MRARAKVEKEVGEEVGEEMGEEVGEEEMREEEVGEEVGKEMGEEVEEEVGEMEEPCTKVKHNNTCITTILLPHIIHLLTRSQERRNNKTPFTFRRFSTRFENVSHICLFIFFSLRAVTIVFFSVR